MLLRTVLKNTAKHERSKLILDQAFIMQQDLTDQLIFRTDQAVLNQSLDNSTREFIDAASNNIVLDLLYEAHHDISIPLFVDDVDDLLDNMIPMKVKDEFQQEAFLLLIYWLL